MQEDRFMRRVFVCLLLSTSCLLAQDVTAPEFDVVSVKPGGDKIVRDSSGGYSFYTRGFEYHPDSVTCDATLSHLIGEAYAVHSWQIAGPEWLAKDKFDFTAKMPPGTSKDVVRAMLQSALASRFHLKLHRETKDVQVYALLVAKDGLKLRPAVHPTGRTSSGGGFYMASGSPISMLVSNLSQYADLPIIDMTDQHGRYEINLQWLPDYQPYDAIVPNGRRDVGILSTLEKQAGLRLEKRIMPYEILVIDSVDRTPTAN